jgi:hypothetical protein
MSIPPRTIADLSREPHPAPQVAGYKVLAELGHGPMGIVYKAQDERLDRIVALKWLCAPALADATHRDRFLATCRALGEVQHPNLVQIFDLAEHERSPLLLLEYCATGSLARHLKRGRPEVAQVVRLIETLARTVAVLHKAGLVHGNLKLSNILLASDPQANVGAPASGFVGLTAKISDALAPDGATPRTDIVALGAIFHECLTGRPPDAAIAERPAGIRPDISPEVEAACVRSLGRDPEHAYTSALAMADELRRLRDGYDIATITCSAAAPPRRTSRRRRWALAAVVAVLATLALVAWLALRPVAEPGDDDLTAEPTVAADPAPSPALLAAADCYKEVHCVDRNALMVWSEGLADAGFEPTALSVCAGAKPLARFNAIAMRASRVGRAVRPGRHFISLMLTGWRHFRGHELMAAKGFDPRCGQLYLEFGRAVEALLWQAATPGWSSIVSNPAEVRERIDTERKHRLRPRSWSMVRVSDKELLAGCQFGPDDGVAWAVHESLSEGDLRAAVDKDRSRGYRPDCLSCYLDGTQVRFLAVSVENSTHAEWVLRTNLTAAEYEGAMAEQAARGLIPHAVTSYLKDGEARYAAIWITAPPIVPAATLPAPPTPAEPIFREVHDIEPGRLDAWAAELTKAGFRPTCLSARAGSREPRLNGIAVPGYRNQQIRFTLIPVDDKWSNQGPWNELSNTFRCTCRLLYADGPRVVDANAWVQGAGYRHTWIGPVRDVFKQAAEDFRERARPVQVGLAHRVDGSQVAACLMEPDLGIVQEIHANATEAQLDKRLEGLRQKGHRPDFLTCSMAGNDLRFTVLAIENRPRINWLVDKDLSTAAYERALTERPKAGMRPVSVASYLKGAETRYLVLWATPE